MTRTEDTIKIHKTVAVDFEVTLSFFKNYDIVREFKREDFDNDDWLNMTEKELYDEYDLYTDFIEEAEIMANTDIDNGIESDYGITYLPMSVECYGTEITDKIVVD